MPRSTATGRIAASGRLVVRDMGTALVFDGVDDLVTVTHHANQLLTTGFTLSAWINPRTTGDSNAGRIFDKTTAAGADGYYFKYSTLGRVGLAIHAGTEISCASGSVPLGQWTHALVTVASGATVTFYINGVASGTPATTSALSNITTTDNLIIGDRTDTTRSFNGSIDEPRIWNVALTQAQITALYQQGTVPTTGLVAEYKFNEGSGTTANDTSGNANHGTITGATYTADVPMKTRPLVNQNLIKNGDFESAPAFTAATTSISRYIDGTSGGSTTNTNFGAWAIPGGGLAPSSGARFATDHTRSGVYSMKLSTLDASGTVVVSNSTSGSAPARRDVIPVLPSTSYTLSVWVKTNNVVTNSVFADAREFSGALSAGVTNTTNKLSGTNDWTNLTQTFTTASTARYVFILLKNGTAGKISDAWFDDLVLKPTTATTRTAA